ncbi:MAG: hypothetical protein U0838_02400 [Chloroflexota bacterium]
MAVDDGVDGDGSASWAPAAREQDDRGHREHDQGARADRDRQPVAGLDVHRHDLAAADPVSSSTTIGPRPASSGTRTGALIAIDTVGAASGAPVIGSRPPSL